MKTLIGLILTVVTHGALAQSVELHVMRDGSQQTVDDQHVAAMLTALVESSSVDSTSYIRPTERWQEALVSTVFIHALFDPPREVRVSSERANHAKRLTTVEEIVVRLSGENGGHIFVKTRGEIRAVTKYSPCAMEKVITAAKLDTAVRVDYLREYCQLHPTASLLQNSVSSVAALSSLVRADR